MKRESLCIILNVVSLGRSLLSPHMAAWCIPIGTSARNERRSAHATNTAAILCNSFHLSTVLGVTRDALVFASWLWIEHLVAWLTCACIDGVTLYCLENVIVVQLVIPSDVGWSPHFFLSNDLYKFTFRYDIVKFLLFFNGWLTRQYTFVIISFYICVFVYFTDIWFSLL